MGSVSNTASVFQTALLAIFMLLARFPLRCRLHPLTGRTQKALNMPCWRFLQPPRAWQKIESKHLSLWDPANKRAFFLSEFWLGWRFGLLYVSKTGPSLIGKFRARAEFHSLVRVLRTRSRSFSPLLGAVLGTKCQDINTDRWTLQRY